MNRVGYACLTLGLMEANLKSCMLKNATPERLSDLISHNLRSLANIISYNQVNHIQVFRISSDLIPFGSHPVNTLSWETQYKESFQMIGRLIQSAKIRVSMHPGQYTILNSPRKEVVQKAMEDLSYHQKVLTALGTSQESKIILHIGGIYGNKKLSAKQFISQFKQLDKSIQDRLVIENDDTSYCIEDVLEIGFTLGIPVVFDTLHHAVHHFDSPKTITEWISECTKTWKFKDGTQKIHYSQQDPGKKPGSHSSTIRIKEFMDFYQTLPQKDLDIMLEVKDKNLSAVKCILAVSPYPSIKELEKEWSRYKYLVLESSPSLYQTIRTLLKEKNAYPVIPFYEMIEEAMQTEPTMGHTLNAIDHVWGYFHDLATESEKKRYTQLQHSLELNHHGVKTIKTFLWTLAKRYCLYYLLNSYYFLNQI